MPGKPFDASETQLQRLHAVLHRSVKRKHWSSHAMILAVIVLTALRESGVIPEGPWSKFIGALVAGFYAYGYVTRPT